MSLDCRHSIVILSYLLSVSCRKIVGPIDAANIAVGNRISGVADFYLFQASPGLHELHHQLILTDSASSKITEFTSEIDKSL